MNRFWLVAALIPALVACAVPEEDFPQAYGKTMCKQLSECNQDDYEEQYADRSVCRDEWTDIGDSILDLGDLLGQTYSEEKATECLSAIKAASCEDFKNANYDCEVFE